MVGCVGHQTSPLSFPKWWDFQQPEHPKCVVADPLALLFCLSNGSVWAMGLSEHGDATAAASAAFPSGSIRRATKFIAKDLSQPSPLLLLVLLTWVFPLLYSPFSHFPAALEEKGVSRRCWGRKSCLQHWRWIQPVPACSLCVLCIWRWGGAPLLPKLSRLPPPP